ncbi:MAG: threonylcarbamoyl-AMP synthase [Thermodesulfobacteriota bacterium]|nr:MAG: threonylcarbamoyl-AMP synthase [Thermodesulfobacteriota bacterium]
MNPVILKLSQNYSNLDELIKKVVLYLKKDKVGAIPTETFYGLAGNPFSEKAIKRLFYLKKRSFDKPILLLIGNLDQLSLIVKEIPPVAENLILKFWPGPLTIIFKAKESLSPLLTAGTKTIGVRLSSSSVAKKICELFGPITGTSANISKSKPSKSAEEVLKEIPEVDFILDGGKLKAKLPSTIVSVVENKLSLIREGVIPFEEIKRAVIENSSL